jgi:hypothetical protein
VSRLLVGRRRDHTLPGTAWPFMVNSRIGMANAKSPRGTNLGGFVC